MSSCFVVLPSCAVCGQKMRPPRAKAVDWPGTMRQQRKGGSTCDKCDAGAPRLRAVPVDAGTVCRECRVTIRPDWMSEEAAPGTTPANPLAPECCEHCGKEGKPTRKPMPVKSAPVKRVRKAEEYVKQVRDFGVDMETFWRELSESPDVVVAPHWRDDAACAGIEGYTQDPYLSFRAGGYSVLKWRDSWVDQVTREWEDQKTLFARCGDCPVRRECLVDGLEYELSKFSGHYVWQRVVGIRGGWPASFRLMSYRMKETLDEAKTETETETEMETRRTA